MKLKKASIIPFIITGAALFLSIGLHVISLRFDTSLTESIEGLTYDARAKLAAAFNNTNKISKQLATLFFDDVAVAKVNNGEFSYYYAPATNDASAQKLYPRLFPWPRFIHGQIVRELAAEGALAIGFDCLFPDQAEPNEYEDVVENGVRYTSDEFFAAQMRKAGNVFLGVQSDAVPTSLFRTNAAGLASISRQDHSILRRVKPFDEVIVWQPRITDELTKALGLQLGNARIEKDRIVIPIVVPGEPGETSFEIPLNPNGSMKLTRDGQIDSSDDPNDEGPMNEFAFKTVRVWNLGIQLAAKALQLDLEKAEIHPRSIVLRGPQGIERKLPLDESGFLYIDWSIRFQEIKSARTPIEFGQLFNVLINDRFRAQGEPNDETPFAGKVVLIGSVVQGNNMSDFGATPLDAQTPLVTKHLNIANSILIGRFVERTSTSVEVILIGTLGLIAAMITWRSKVIGASIAIAILTICYILFTVWMYLKYRYWIPIAMPVGGGLILPHFALITYRVVFEQKEQRRVRGIFSRMLAPDVVQELLNAERLSLGGARRKLTVLFADVRGFTEFTDGTQRTAEEFVTQNSLSHAEAQVYFDRIAAEQLATVNLYLATIADIVKNHHGTFDKYMGDCVMAFWGAPIANAGHAVACVRAAIDAQRALHLLNDQREIENQRRTECNSAGAGEGKPPLPMLPLLALGTGINTGWVTVGLMGSDATQLNYTVFGREVNLASRLEGASGRGRILIGETTYEELLRDAPDLAASCVPQAPITPKGFRNAVKVFEVPWRPAGTTASVSHSVPIKTTATVA